MNLQYISGSIADVERNVKVGGMPNSKIPSIFDHTILDSSTIKSYYQVALATQVVPAYIIPNMQECRSSKYDFRIPNPPYQLLKRSGTWNEPLRYATMFGMIGEEDFCGAS